MDIALDATGLAVRKYTPRWFSTGYSIRGRDFIKLHAAIELKTQAFVSWEYTYSNTHEARVAPTLLQNITGRIQRVFADSGYLSQQVCLAVHARGATPLIRPKKTSKGRQGKYAYKGAHRPHEAYLDMMDSYQSNPEAWLKEYHQRSRIESAFGALKQRLGHGLSAMVESLQMVELTLRLVAWNITRITGWRAGLHGPV